MEINELSVHPTARDLLAVRELLGITGGHLARQYARLCISRRVGYPHGATCHHRWRKRMQPSRAFGPVFCLGSFSTTCEVCGASKQGLEKLRQHYPDRGDDGVLIMPFE